MHKWIVFLLALVVPLTVAAHPGRTASDGCHYCRTRCDYWGQAWNARHCHGGYTAPTPSYSPPKPSCPANAYKSGSSCVCKSGYATSLDKSRCIKIPANAHKSYGATDVWECDSGYVESGNRCIPIPKKVEKKVIEEPDPEVKTEELPVKKYSDEEIEEIKEVINQVRQGIDEATNQSDDGFGGFMLGAITVSGLYWLYKKYQGKKGKKSI